MDSDDLFDAQPQSLLLTIFGAYLAPRTAAMWSGGLVTALGYFGVTAVAARVTLTRLVQRGLARRQRDGRHVYYTLTDRTLHLLEDSDERVFALAEPRREPATTWTLVWHNLPDSRKVERSQFVKQLRFHGFGPLHDGMWAAPRDYAVEVADLVDRLRIGDAVTIFRAAPFGDVLSGPLLDQLWQLDEVARRYRRFADQYGELTHTHPGPMPEREAFVRCTEVLQSFRSFADIDPELPEDWITHSAARREAFTVFQQVLARLKEPAAAHFRQLTRTG